MGQFLRVWGRRAGGGMADSEQSGKKNEKLGIWRAHRSLSIEYSIVC